MNTGALDLKDNRRDIPALPFCKVTLKALKPKRFYPMTLNSTGDLLRKKRLDAKLFQKELARILGTDKATINNWETGRTIPSIAFIPRIIEFLRYLPYDSTKTGLKDKIRRSRECLGLSQERLARNLEIDPTTIRKWESGKTRPSMELLKRLDQYFNSFLLASGEAEQ